MSSAICQVYYLTGTGNSVQITKRLEAELGAEIRGMASFQSEQKIRVECDMLGLVVPVYFLDIPHFVKEFVSKLEIHPDTFVFSIVHCGALPGFSLSTLHKMIEKNGAKLNSAHIVYMPDNSIVFYTKKEKIHKMLQDFDHRLNEVIASLRVKKEKSVKRDTPTFFLPEITKSIFHLFGVNKKRVLAQQCINCGLCKRLCPVECISYTDGEPVWKKGCVYCFACIHWCPNRAIRFGSLKITDKSGYTNPNCSAEEIEAQKFVS
ncbi:EFR1 family ferrodoxin [Chitinispirillales bacterium ANBcel5]|uniref:EFR1 family ferrodoxin n=1 Tax=Cellulosispirillum alkaliphilum TaxID=3039283 RepID=UPI002A4F16C3|nr:EFR1 family ferrodoxin [Chitinispirillales bacterium ANBcel5]